MSRTLVIEEPALFFSDRDEDYYFEWLQSIPAVEKIIGTPSGLELTLTDTVDKESLYELIAIATRYNTDRTCLRVLCNSENKLWFKDRNKYWYDSVFES